MNLYTMGIRREGQVSLAITGLRKSSRKKKTYDVTLKVEKNKKLSEIWDELNSKCHMICVTDVESEFVQ